MDSSKYFNLSQYSTLKAKDDTLPTVREDTKVEGGPKTGNDTDRDSDDVYMNFNPSKFTQALMHLKNQLPSPMLIKWLPEHKTYLPNKTLLGRGNGK